MTPVLVALVNGSSAVTRQDAERIADAVSEQVAGPFAQAWLAGPAPEVRAYGSGDMVPVDAWVVSLLDTPPEQAGELGVHWEAGALPRGDVYVAPILSDGGTVLKGADSVSVTASHEIVELLVDPPANRWAQSGDGALYALEPCDPCEGTCYPASSGADVSDYALPGWFDPGFAGVCSYAGTLTKPFLVDAAGYAIVEQAGGSTEVFGGGRTQLAFRARLAPGRWVLFGPKVPGARVRRRVEHLMRTRARSARRRIV